MTIKSGSQVFDFPLLTALGLLDDVVAFSDSVWNIVSIWRATRI